MEPGSNYIQAIHNSILTIMDLKCQHDIALVRVLRARHVPRTENCRRLLFATVTWNPVMGCPHVSSLTGTVSLSMVGMRMLLIMA